jgi:hypothetical protein
MSSNRPYFPVAKFQKEKHFLELTGTLGLSEIYIHENNDKGRVRTVELEDKVLDDKVLNSLGTASRGSQLQNTLLWPYAGSSVSNSYTLTS